MNIAESLLILITISFVLRHCNALRDYQKLTEWTGVIASPGVDTGIYEDSKDCQWDIKVTRGSRVKITFEMFDLEEGSMPRGSKTKSCVDYVKVNDSSGQILYECGALAVPPEVMSASEVVTVFFHSDESGAGKGFKAVYTGVCALDITRNALLETPNYPNPPPFGVKCSWSIRGQNGQIHIIKTVAGAGAALPAWGSSPLKINSGARLDMVSELCLQESRQAYAGDISVIYESSSTSVATWTGQLQVEFADNMDCSKVCAHNSACHPVMKFPKLVLNCVCVQGYDGIACENRKDICPARPCNLNSSHCVEKRDNVPGSAILWSTTLVKDFDTKPCPHGALGEATRYCVSDLESSSGGLWTRPDLSVCVSPNMMRILHDANVFVRNVSMVDTEHLSNITSRLVEATNLTLDFKGNWHELFPGDLSTAVDVLGVISEAENFVDTEVTGDFIQLSELCHRCIAGCAHYVLQLLFQECLDYIATVDNILDPKTAETWRNALAGLVEAKVSTLIESTQVFISKMVLSMISGRGPNLTLAGGAGADTEDFKSRTLFERVMRNLNITVVTLSAKDRVYGAFRNIASTSSVVFPGIWLNSSDTGLSDVPLTVYVARFSSVSPLLSLSESRYHKESQNDSNIINSDVLSVEFLNISNLYFQHLTEPVILTFLLQDPSLGRYYVEQCVFMNMSATSYKDRWATSGCQVAESNDTHVVCHCNHLTNFAVLMDIYNNQKVAGDLLDDIQKQSQCHLPPTWKLKINWQTNIHTRGMSGAFSDNIDSSNKLMLTYISYVGGSLSILACVITIIVFHYFKLGGDRIRTHQQLAVCIIFVQVLFICVGKTGKEYKTPLIVCRTVAALLHYCLTAMFCWMLVEGIHLYIVLVRVFKRGFHFKKYLLVGWGIPLVVVGVSLGAFHDKYGVASVCWLSQDILLVCFVPAVALVITINTVILALVIRLIIKTNNYAHKFQTQERSNIRLGVKAAVVLLPLLGLTWVLGFLAVNTGRSGVPSYVFTYLFTITNSFQGVLFFIFHCLLNVDVRQAYERRYKKRKRSPCVETASSRLRKLSAPELSHSNNQHAFSRNMNPVFSIVNNLSPIGSRTSLSIPVNGPGINKRTWDSK